MNLGEWDVSFIDYLLVSLGYLLFISAALWGLSCLFDKGEK